jgi:hypothetical protein
MAVRRISPAAASAIVCAALASWISLGAIALTSGDTTNARVAILPSVGWLAVFVAAGLLVIVLGRPRARRVAILWLSALVILPWLPVRLPPAIFLWAGTIRFWMWVAIAATIVISMAATRASASIRRGFAAPRTAALWAAALSAAAFSLGAWAVAPRMPVGDEPHYLVITQSLLLDHDLQIENNHRRGDYRAYFRAGDMKPDYLKRGVNGQIYSVHAPGLPVIIAPAFALFGYRGVQVMLIAIAACATALAWLVAWRVTGDARASWFAWAVVALSVPFFFQAFAVFPDGLGAALILVGILPLIDERARRPPPLFVVGAAVAILPWLHTRFALAAAALSLVVLGRIGRAGAKSVAAFVIAPLVATAAWLAFFYVIYATPNPSAPYGGARQLAVANVARGIPGLLLDQQFGLLPNAPAYACAIAGLVVMLRGGLRRLVLELAAVGVPYFLAVAAFPMWWAGYSSPARFLVPMSLVLAIPAAVWFKTRRTDTARLLGVGAVLASAIIVAAIATTERGATLFNERDGASRLVMAISPVVDLTTALPSLFATTPARTLFDAALWLGAVAIVHLVVRPFERRGYSGQPLAAILAGVAALTVFATASIVWQAKRAAPLTPSRGGFALLRRFDPTANLIAVAYAPFGRIQPSDVPSRLALADPIFRTRATNPAVLLSDVPPGVYEVDGLVRHGAGGRIRVATDARLPSIAEWQLAPTPGPWSETLTLPVTMITLRVDADRAAQASLAGLSLRARRVFGPRDGWPASMSGHATRYGPAVVFLTAGHAYMEPEGTWVAGGFYADFVILPDDKSTIRLFVRNSAAHNSVTLTSGSWREQFPLRPGEERFIVVPNDGSRTGVPLRVVSESGAVPADVDPRSNDVRFLGCWVETR